MTKLMKTPAVSLVCTLMSITLMKIGFNVVVAGGFIKNKTPNALETCMTSMCILDPYDT